MVDDEDYHPTRQVGGAAPRRLKTRVRSRKPAAPGGFVGTFTPEFLEAIRIANLVATLWQPKSDREKMSACDTLMTMASSPSSWEHLVKAGVIKHLIRLLESQSLKSHAAGVLTRLLCACGAAGGAIPRVDARKMLIDAGSIKLTLDALREPTIPHNDKISCVSSLAAALEWGEDAERAIASAGGGKVLLEVLQQAQLAPTTAEQHEVLTRAASALALTVIKKAYGVGGGGIAADSEALEWALAMSLHMLTCDSAKTCVAEAIMTSVHRHRDATRPCTPAHKARLTRSLAGLLEADGITSMNMDARVLPRRMFALKALIVIDPYTAESTENGTPIRRA
jgi:hypothetical protein